MFMWHSSASSLPKHTLNITHVIIFVYMVNVAFGVCRTQRHSSASFGHMSKYCKMILLNVWFSSERSIKMPLFYNLREKTALETYFQNIYGT